MEFIIAKEILSKVQYDNSHWFGIDYNMNLYIEVAVMVAYTVTAEVIVII